MSKQTYGIWRRTAEVNGMSEYNLRVFGNTLAEREGYQAHEGIEAVHFYLCTTYGWVPSVVRSLSLDDMMFLLAEEMHDWKMPSDAL